MLLSVIIPVHNTAGYLPQCVKSVIRQGLRHEDFEIILIENASTDNSLHVCNELKKQYPEINILTISTKTPCVGNARNLGLDVAQGEYVHFIDSDDWIADGMYAQILSENILDYDVIVTGIINDYVVKTQLEEAYPSTDVEFKTSTELANFLLRLDSKQKVWCLNVIWNKWYKTNIIKQNSIRFRDDINLGEDFVFNCSYFEKMSAMKIIPDSFYHYMHRGNITLVNKFRNDILYRRPIIYDTYCKLYEHYGILTSKKCDIDWLEGKLLFGSLYSVFCGDCPLSFSGKINFIKGVCEAEYFKLGYGYLRNSSMLFHKLLIKLILLKQYKGVYFMLWMRLKIRSIGK